jgi:hypothetical protein
MAPTGKYVPVVERQHCADRKICTGGRTRRNLERNTLRIVEGLRHSFGREHHHQGEGGKHPPRKN